MERAYSFPIRVTFKVVADNPSDADEIAAKFAEYLTGWVDGGLGSPPFAQWMTAWKTEDPTWLEEQDPTEWPLWPVTHTDIKTNAPWGLEE